MKLRLLFSTISVFVLASLTSAAGQNISAGLTSSEWLRNGTFAGQSIGEFAVSTLGVVTPEA